MTEGSATSGAASPCSVDAVTSFPNARGFIGVDLVLGEKADDDRIIEINPRPTTSYCALRRRSSVNLARLSLDLLDHREPELPEWPAKPELFDSEGNAGEWPGGRVGTAPEMERVS